MRMEKKRNQIVELTGRLPLFSGAAAGHPVAAIRRLAGDGSQRQFYRVRMADGSFLVAVFPAGGQRPERDEARSAWLIGRHLFQKGVPVPRPLAFAEDSGLLLIEDLGDVRLFDLARKDGGSGAALMEYYRQAVRALVHMQIEGGRGFDVSWCWQTPRYDRRLMLERESGYFLQALCGDFLRLETPGPELHNEFNDIADHAGRAPAHFFLHRDFQSRNLMIRDNVIRIIDFQGGRLGPLAYDLASLLIDPYVRLPGEAQDELLNEYLRELHRYLPYDAGQFRDEYFHLALQRNMQALGAFAFLGCRRGKADFLEFVRPALYSLHILLAGQSTRNYPRLLQLVERCLDSLPAHGL